LVLLVFRCADADIEAILQKGERETADLNDKMNKFTESAKQFTMDGGLSLYDFKEDVSGVAPRVGAHVGVNRDRPRRRMRQPNRWLLWMGKCPAVVLLF
jgi:hypothetical protein